ncbi:hypothetical protein BJ170DRAFT_384714 [Xylariales sp. AK1849]|nr:hypothetical protein BJ170DRAFT_384714 [Xylariales sp. AK1849]
MVVLFVWPYLVVLGCITSSRASGTVAGEHTPPRQQNITVNPAVTIELCVCHGFRQSLHLSKPSPSTANPRRNGSLRMMDRIRAVCATSPPPFHDCGF